MTTPGPQLLPNPGAEVDTVGWSAPGATLVRVTAGQRSGVGAFQVTATAAGTVNLTAADITTGFVAGGLLNVAGYTKAAAVAGRNVTLVVDWYSATGYLSSSGVGGKVSSTAAYVELLGTVAIPAAATKASVYGQVQGAAASEVHLWDDFAVTSGSAAAGAAQPADSTTRIAGIETATRVRAWIGGVQTP